ncbi:hypothetical protein GCM10018980_22570 [Streptomyces capoamus]|uniref:Uncharacterized protein n=1 Tax=Streptomyces capoamus TaxID=68183 RepID=A0A919C359_9ACTN|nr:hypothetical protein GCM10010501_01330 [Streptomyces libani subsp. rufus]GHG44557.1 hypothetical protein GCM10018980_22570 [Streptomyces capoamus]
MFHAHCGDRTSVPPRGTRWCPEEGRRIADVLLGRIDVQGGDLVAGYLQEGGDGREDGSGVADGDAVAEEGMRPC